RAAPSAATVAANGVDFLEPLNPALPEDPHATALPCASVIVIVVLLNVALMCATPSASTTRFAFFPVAITLLGCLLLARDCAARPLLGARVRVRPLAANRQAPAVTNPAIGADVHQPLDVHRDLGPERAFDAVLLLDRLTQLVDVGIGQVANALLTRN